MFLNPLITLKFRLASIRDTTVEKNQTRLSFALHDDQVDAADEELEIKIERDVIDEDYRYVSNNENTNLSPEIPDIFDKARKSINDLITKSAKSGRQSILSRVAHQKSPRNETTTKTELSMLRNQPVSFDLNNQQESDSNNASPPSTSKKSPRKSPRQKSPVKPLLKTSTGVDLIESSSSSRSSPRLTHSALSPIKNKIVSDKENEIFDNSIHQALDESTSYGKNLNRETQVQFVFVDQQQQQEIQSKMCADGLANNYKDDADFINLTNCRKSIRLSSLNTHGLMNDHRAESSDKEVPTVSLNTDTCQENDIQMEEDRSQEDVDDTEDFTNASPKVNKKSKSISYEHEPLDQAVVSSEIEATTNQQEPVMFIEKSSNYQNNQEVDKYEAVATPDNSNNFEEHQDFTNLTCSRKTVLVSSINVSNSSLDEHRATKQETDDENNKKNDESSQNEENEAQFELEESKNDEKQPEEVEVNNVIQNEENLNQVNELENDQQSTDNGKKN